MTKRFPAQAAALMVCWLLLFGYLAGPAAMSLEQGKQPAEGFGLTYVWNLHLEMTAKEYEAMQPPKGKGFSGGPGGPPATPKDKQPASGRASEKCQVDELRRSCL